MFFELEDGNSYCVICSFKDADILTRLNSDFKFFEVMSFYLFVYIYPGKFPWFIAM